MFCFTHSLSSRGCAPRPSDTLRDIKSSKPSARPSSPLEEWVESTTISREQKDGLIYPFLASLNNQEIEASKQLSARGGVYFVSRALSDNPFAGVTYYNSLFGLGGIVQRLAEACTTLTVVAGAPSNT